MNKSDSHDNTKKSYVNPMSSDSQALPNNADSGKNILNPPKVGQDSQAGDELSKLMPLFKHSDTCPLEVTGSCGCASTHRWRCIRVAEAYAERLATKRAIAVLQAFELPKYDHSKCPDPKTCIGYQNAESDFDNEKALKIAALSATLAKEAEHD